MATQVFLLATIPDTHRGTNTAKLDGSTAGWQPFTTGTTRPGTGSTTDTTNTVGGATNGVEVDPLGGVPNEWLTPPVDQDVTISGTITGNIWASENSMNANVAINFRVHKVAATDGTLTEIAKSARVTELGTSIAAANFTVTPTSTALAKGDRLRITVFGDDAVTMASGFTFDVAYGGGIGAGTTGDTFITFNETFGFQTTDPTGSTLYPTDTASDVATASVDREMWTSRGAGVQNDVTNTAAGWTAPIHVTDTAGGTVVDWFSKQLQAFTLGGLVKVNLRASESNAAANASVGVQIARVNADGTNATVWGYANRSPSVVGTGRGEITTTEAAYPIYVAGDDLAFTDGQRLRLRFFVDDCADANLITGNTVTTYYAGTSGGASGDTFLTFEQTLAEFVSAPAEDPQHRSAPLVTVGYRQPQFSPPILASQFFDPILAPVIVIVDSAGQLTLTGQTVTLAVSATPTAGALTLTGQSSILTLSTTPTAGALTLTGQGVTLTISANPNAGALTLTGQGVTVTISTSPNEGALTLSGATDITLDLPTLAAEQAQNLTPPHLRVVQPFNGPPILATQDFQQPWTELVTVDTAGLLTLTGQAVTVSVSANPTAGALTLTGQSPTLTLSTSPTAGALTLTGQTATLTISANPNAGVLTLTGQGVTLTATATANAGAITLTGQVVLASGEVGAIWQPQTHLRLVAPFNGPPVLAHQEFTFAAATIVTTVDTPGLVTLTGQTVALSVSASPNAGALTLTGQSPTITLSMSANAGALTLAGQAPALSITTTPTAGALTLAGRTAALSVLALTQPGTITFTGGNPDAAGSGTDTFDDVHVHIPTAKWVLGPPEAKWIEGQPGRKWQDGEPEPKWEAEGPSGKFRDALRTG